MAEQRSQRFGHNYRTVKTLHSPHTRRSLLADLENLGVAKNDVVVVHASVRSVGPIIGGVNTLVEALLDATGDGGTVVAYVDWESGFEPYESDPVFAADIPVFDKRLARAARAYGILAEVVRGWPAAVRSDNPDAGIAAIGSRAAWLCENQAFTYGYGDTSPYAKLLEIAAKILVLGAPLDTITLLHHAEHVAPLTSKRVRRYRRKVIIDGHPSWIDVEEFDTSVPVVNGMPDDHFAQIAERALTAGAGHRGSVGLADAYLFDARSLHRITLRWLEEWQCANAAETPPAR